MMRKSYSKILSEEEIDFIVVTGDLHNYGVDYTETKKLLDEILLARKLEKSSLFIVTGNHDSKDFKSKNMFKWERFSFAL